MIISYLSKNTMRQNFHILDGLKIGGIEKLALTLSSQKILNEENYILNITKFNKFCSERKKT